MKRLFLIASAVLISMSTIASARTWYIRPDGTGDAPTIQAGIDSASTYDEVVLANGTYRGEGNRDIDFRGKAITVRSESGDPRICIIDCEGVEWPEVVHRGFNFRNSEDEQSVLSGVTITNGNSGMSGDGGAIYTTHASPTIKNCVLSNNKGHLGAGMYCRGGRPQVSSCLFVDNLGGEGAGVFCDDSSPVFACCIFLRNEAGLGGAMEIYRVHTIPTPYILNCTFCRNSASAGAAILLGNLCAPVIEKTIIAYNKRAAAVECYAGEGDPVLTCSNLYANEGGDWVDCVADQYGTNGNFSEDPYFCSLTSGEECVELQENSPCLHWHGCGLIGALGEGCLCSGDLAGIRTGVVGSISWGAIKSMYR